MAAATAPAEREVQAYPHQMATLEALDRGIRYIAMMGGTGGGKTWWGPWWLADVIGRDVAVERLKGARYLVLAPTAEMVRDVVVPLVRDAYAGTKLQGRYAEQKNIYRLRGGGTILFRSADKPERIEGHHVRGVWADEPGQMKALVWTIIKARAAYHQAPVLMTGYPWARNWYETDVYNPWQAGDPNYCVLQFPSTANPDYPAQAMAEAEATVPNWLFQMRYHGKFMQPAGLVYGDWSAENWCDPFDIPGDWPRYAALDPAGIFGALWFAEDPDSDLIYLYAEYLNPVVQTAKAHAVQLTALARGRANLEDATQPVLLWYYDPARLTDITELNAAGINPLVPADNAIFPGLATVAGFIKSRRLRAFRGRLPHFADELASYRRPTNPSTGEVLSDLPIKKRDHLMDCSRYFLHTHYGGGRLSTDPGMHAPPPSDQLVERGRLWR